MKQPKKIFFILTLILVGVFVAGNFAFALSLTTDVPCAQPAGSNKMVKECGICDFIQVFINASQMMAAGSGAVALLMFVIGGIVMITAYGSTDRVTWGKNMVIAAVTGIIIIFSAWTLVNVVLKGFGYGGPWSVCPEAGQTQSTPNVTPPTTPNATPPSTPNVTPPSTPQ